MFKDSALTSPWSAKLLTRLSTRTGPLRLSLPQCQWPKTLIFMDSIHNPHQRQPLLEGGTTAHSVLLQSVSETFLYPRCSQQVFGMLFAEIKTVLFSRNKECSHCEPEAYYSNAWICGVRQNFHFANKPLLSCTVYTKFLHVNNISSELEAARAYG